MNSALRGRRAIVETQIERRQEPRRAQRRAAAQERPASAIPPRITSRLITGTLTPSNTPT